MSLVIPDIDSYFFVTLAYLALVFGLLAYIIYKLIH